MNWNDDMATRRRSGSGSHRLVYPTSLHLVNNDQQHRPDNRPSTSSTFHPYPRRSDYDNNSSTAPEHYAMSPYEEDRREKGRERARRDEHEDPSMIRSDQYQHRSTTSISASSSSKSPLQSSTDHFHPSALNVNNHLTASPRHYEHPDPISPTSPSTSLSQPIHIATPQSSQNDTNMSSFSTSPQVQTRKRLSGKTNTPAACASCKRAHLSCDPGRPCRRCINLNRPDTCIDVPHKKRGRPKLLTSTSHGASTSLNHLSLDHQTGTGGGLNHSPSGVTRTRGTTISHPSQPYYTEPTSPNRTGLGLDFLKPNAPSNGPFIGPDRERTRWRSTEDLRFRRVGRARGGLGVRVDPPAGGGSTFHPPPYSSRQGRTGDLQERKGWDLEAVLGITNALILKDIVPFKGNDSTFGPKGSVLDKACLDSPILDFVHPEDRDAVRDAVFCALVTKGELERVRERERDQRDTMQLDSKAGILLEDDEEPCLVQPPKLPYPIHTEKEMIAYLSQEEQHRGTAVVRLKDVMGIYIPFSIVVRNDPAQSFLSGRNDLVLGLERCRKRGGTETSSSVVTTPRSVQEFFGSLPDSPVHPGFNQSPLNQTNLVLPSFSTLSAGLEDPRSWASIGPTVPPPQLAGSNRFGPPSSPLNPRHDFQQLSISAPSYVDPSGRFDTSYQPPITSPVQFERERNYHQWVSRLPNDPPNERHG